MAKGSLDRVVGLPGATMMGLGSIVGTGVFVSLGLGAGIVGTSMIFALLIAGFLAVCNGLSTAQLAADHPMSGGTYEYGYKYVGGWAGYMAGWMFMCAKSASAATAAMGFGGYLLSIVAIPGVEAWHLAIITVIAMLLLTSSGIKRSNLVNSVIVGITILTLLVFVCTAAFHMNTENFSPPFENSVSGKGFSLSFLEAIALMFVTYTGYGRVATLGEEITNPKKNIPRAVITTLALTFVIYLSVAFVSLGTIGAKSFYEATMTTAAPLQFIATTIDMPIVAKCLALGAMTAMLGVLLNLILGLSRVILAMGRRGDLPQKFSHTDEKNGSPKIAIFTSGAVILSLVLLKDIKAAWSFSALTVLIYYAVTNLSALKLPKEKRLYPRIFAWIGFLGCLSLGFWVEVEALRLGAIVLLAGIFWRLGYRKISA